MPDYRSLNRSHWDERAPAHAASPDYAVERFVADAAYLSDVVRFDRPRLGEIAGLRGVHLQCHIGTDTLSLSRLGAQMSGLDFSAASIEQARGLARRVGAGAGTGADVDFHVADVYDAPDVFGRHACDLVYTGIGALCWLPSIRRWAQVVDDLLRPGGRLFIREAHPMLWALADPRQDGLLTVEFPYFERVAALVWDEPGTYVQTDVVFEHNLTHSWNHGLGQIMTALLDVGMQMTMFIEHDSVPWNALPGQMEPIGGGEYRLTDRPWRLPHTYTLQAHKRAVPV